MNPRLITGDFSLYCVYNPFIMFYAICYVSTANNLLDFQIRELMSSTANANQKRKITGVLMYNAGNFLQYMEGTKTDVISLYRDKIKEDTRHKNLIVLLEKEIDHLYFDGYNAGFTSILEQNNNTQFRSYIELLKHIDTSEVRVVTNTIETFLGKSLNK